MMPTELLLSDVQRQDIANACQSYGVKRLELFGSRSRHDSSDSSDYDFIVEFINPLIPGVFERFLALNKALEQIFEGEVDLVEISSIENPFLQRSIDEDRILIYAA